MAMGKTGRDKPGGESRPSGSRHTTSRQAGSPGTRQAAAPQAHTETAGPAETVTSFDNRAPGGIRNGVAGRPVTERRDRLGRPGGLRMGLWGSCLSLARPPSLPAGGMAAAGRPAFAAGLVPARFAHCHFLGYTARSELIIETPEASGCNRRLGAVAGS